MEKIKLAIIGASYLQEPLIQKAKSRGIETHVFAWAANDIGEKSADYFYPISIIEKEKILQKCREIGIDGICSIASDLATVTVSYVADAMGLVANSLETVEVSTNKHLMRECFRKNGDPSPKSIQVTSVDDLVDIDLHYPIIVKPVDRSGSRGITKLDSRNGLEKAISDAIEQGFEKCALVEEFATGQEYSVEYISWKGKHTFLAMTKKYTTGAPHFIETAHIEPAGISDAILLKVQNVVSHALDSLGIEYGASHSEIKISDEGEIKIIEIGGRMGGDNIGADLVRLSTGYNFVDAVIDVALGIEPREVATLNANAGIRFIMSEEDIQCLNVIKNENPDIIVSSNIGNKISGEVTDSSTRFGFYVIASDDRDIIEKYMP